MSGKAQRKQVPQGGREQVLAECLPSPSPLLPDSPANEAATALPLPHAGYSYGMSEQQQKVIPGYNFQSLFRKKSHIKLSRKKSKEETMKRSLACKSELAEKESKNIQKGHWTAEENKLYHYFLEIHNRHFILKHLRRTDKIFKSMASFIKSREAEQCRSHHQKMEKKYHNFYHILIKLRTDFYNSLNPDELAQELEQRGLRVREDRLISEEELRNGDLLSKEQREERGEEAASEESLASVENGNLLSENYENDLDFNRMPFQP